MASLTGLLIPTDPTKPCQLVAVESDHLAAAIGAELFEIVHHSWLRSHDLVMLVDEEGLLVGRELNARAAAAFYPYGQGIVGDALILAEVETEDGELDLAGLTAFQAGPLAALDALRAVA